MNPEKYEAQAELANSSRINANLFDDFFDDDNDNDSSDSDTGSDEMSPVIQRQINRLSSEFSLPVPTDSSFETSLEHQTRGEKTMTLAEVRDKQIDDEILKYGNISKPEFTEFCNSRGLTRGNPYTFEPIGAITWEWWRSKKQEFPIIYAAIKTVLQAPTSSSAIERLFSRVSAYTTNQKNRFKSKNLMALLQISEMDSFQRISGDIFMQHGIKVNNETETEYHSSTLNEQSDSDSSDIEDFDELFSVSL